MKQANYNGVKSLFMVLVLLMMAISIVYAENSVEPSALSTITIISNTSTAYPHGNTLNETRGYIHSLEVIEAQPTFKWIGYVGNITGTYALQDSNGYALYDWTIATTTGEVYATKEGSGSDSPGTPDGEQGGIPYWENITCANLANLTQEQDLFNHTTTYGATANEDSYLQTFTVDGGTWGLDNNFFVGQEVQITGTGCYGADLHSNDTKQTGEWEEIVLTDLTKEQEHAAGQNNDFQQDIIYASLIENNTDSYQNNTPADFQILLPQSGLEGSTVPNIAFYFYIELI